MPDERMRSLRWGLELLHLIGKDSHLSDGLRIQARDLTALYPDQEALLLSITESAPLKAEWAEAIQHAAELFAAIRRSQRASPKVLGDVRFVLRHFPDEATVRSMARGHLDDWLAIES